ncbi:hypothetical protein [Neolewinella sp.]|uniref:hypothetical protein n=1 Tax=Neolewinella sp. TaxID=2993543 RepID=UPI003B529506
MALRLLLCLLPFTTLLGQPTDSLLQSVAWQEEGTGYRLVLTADGTFEQDYGTENRGAARYLLGRYALDADSRELTLSVDYFLGKSRIPNRYRRERDFYLPYRIDSLTADRLVLTDLVTRNERRFAAQPLRPEDDPLKRHTPAPQPVKLKLPGGWLD